jgi:hypothetical protein
MADEFFVSPRGSIADRYSLYVMSYRPNSAVGTSPLVDPPLSNISFLGFGLGIVYLYHTCMALVPLGTITVTTAGTLVPLTTIANVRAQTVFIQVLKATGGHSNTGQIYVYFGQTAGTAIRIATLGVPSAGNVPAFSATIPGSSGSLVVGNFWLDADTSTDGVDACYLGP